MDDDHRPFRTSEIRHAGVDQQLPSASRDDDDAPSPCRVFDAFVTGGDFG